MSSLESGLASRGVRDLAIAGLCWAFVLITPFPFTAAGSAQPSHALVILIVLISLTRREIVNLPLAVPLSWLLFASYVAVSSAIWASILGDMEPLVYAGPIILGVLVFLSFVVEIRRDARRVLAALRWASFLALILQSIMLLSANWAPGVARGSLFFSNPNQLAYFTLLATSIFLASHQIREDAPPLMTWIALGCASVLVVFSGSKAGLLGVVVLLALALLAHRRGRGVVMAILSLTLLLALPYLIELITTWGQVMFVFGQQDDSFAGRGYDRLWRFPYFLILGAGEGVFQRFSGLYDVEIHSTIGAILFSYGVVGTGLLMAAVIFSLDRFMRGPMYLLPVLVYGVAHNGIRQPLFWVLLAIALTYGYAAGSIRARQEVADGSSRSC